MKLAITGLSNSGKTTIFNALTGKKIETTSYLTTGGSPHLGIVKVPDPRIERLAEIYKPKNPNFASIEYVDYIGLNVKDVSHNAKVIEHIKDADAIVQIVRAFEDLAVQHPLNDIEPLRDIRTVEAEIVFHDLELADKRLERMDEAVKKGKKSDAAEKKLLLRCKENLEVDIPLRNIDFSEDEQKAMRHLQFITIKPEIVVLNITEKDLNSEKVQKLQENAQKYYTGRGFPDKIRVITLCGSIEMEISQLEPQDAKAFLDDIGIHEPAMNKLINVSYDLLGLISFITIGDDEIKAWTITKGTNALNAAGKVHSDIERGFIKAEVISYDNFISCGNMAAARDKGLIRLEGKKYEVRDGDIINFRFNI